MGPWWEVGCRTVRRVDECRRSPQFPLALAAESRYLRALGDSPMLTGSCFCGAVRYEIVGDLGKKYYCHCSRCRKTSGSAFTANAVVSPSQFRFVEGEAEVSIYTTADGISRTFCSRCGSHLIVSQDDQMRLRLGSLDTPLNRSIDMHIFTGSKADWEEINDGKPQYLEKPTV
jgi:hypothetical protein